MALAAALLIYGLVKAMRCRPSPKATGSAEPSENPSGTVSSVCTPSSASEGRGEISESE
jgi:hypothetical protein